MTFIYHLKRKWQHKVVKLLFENLYTYSVKKSIHQFALIGFMKREITKNNKNKIWKSIIYANRKDFSTTFFIQKRFFEEISMFDQKKPSEQLLLKCCFIFKNKKKKLIIFAMGFFFCRVGLHISHLLFLQLNWREQ